MTDRELIDDILKNNSQRAFEELVNRYQPMVLNTCRGFVNSFSDAEDLAQEVFIEVFESLKGFRSEAKISTWIYRIAVNKSLNQVRKFKRNMMFRSIESYFPSNGDANESLQLYSRDGEGADSNIERSENKELLKQAINKLPENQRIAFVLSKYQELSYKEIAEVMSVSLSSVESLLFRAKSNLQKYLLKEMAK